jgi:hypothetical protein
MLDDYIIFFNEINNDNNTKLSLISDINYNRINVHVYKSTIFIDSNFKLNLEVKTFLKNNIKNNCDIHFLNIY